MTIILLCSYCFETRDGEYPAFELESHKPCGALISADPPSPGHGTTSRLARTRVLVRLGKLGPVQKTEPSEDSIVLLYTRNDAAIPATMWGGGGGGGGISVHSKAKIFVYCIKSWPYFMFSACLCRRQITFALGTPEKTVISQRILTSMGVGAFSVPSTAKIFEYYKN